MVDSRLPRSVSWSDQSYQTRKNIGWAFTNVTQPATYAGGLIGVSWLTNSGTESGAAAASGPLGAVHQRWSGGPSESVDASHRGVRMLGHRALGDR